MVTTLSVNKHVRLTISLLQMALKVRCYLLLCPSQLNMLRMLANLTVQALRKFLI